MASTYEPIASQTLGSATTTVDFTSIAANWTDLVLVANFNASSGSPNAKLRVNGDTGTNYSNTILHGNGSSAGSSRQSNSGEMSINWNVNLSTTSNNFLVWQIMSYANTNVFKTMLWATGNAGGEVIRTVGLWRSTSAITSLSVFTASLSFASGSTFSLFGLKAA